MRLLLDTHFVQWLAIDPGRIDRRERALIARSELLISPVSIWELRIKRQKFRDGRRRDDVLDPASALEHVARTGLKLVPLTGADCTAALETPLPHGDPFDEMLLIHAWRLGARLLTRDTQLIGHPLAVSA